MAWIRSQDKVDLVDAREIYLEGTTMDHSPFSLESEYTVLGYFSTKESALAELDRIEEWIRNGAQGVYQVSSE